MAERGHRAERVWSGSVTDPAAFRCPAEPEVTFDAALCCGVLPHIPDDLEDEVLAHLRGALRPGGRVVVEARNSLFGLFTLNRYSWELFRDELVRADRLRELADEGEREPLEGALSALEGLFRTDQPPLRRGAAGEPGYDEVLSRTHHPLQLAESVRAAGFAEVTLLHYHYHALPPMIADRVPDLARRASLAMEDPTDPRGLVMASAFLATGVAA
jgi:SAM-dependent methyltransferase